MFKCFIGATAIGCFVAWLTLPSEADRQACKSSPFAMQTRQALPARGPDRVMRSPSPPMFHNTASHNMVQQSALFTDLDCMNPSGSTAGAGPCAAEAATAVQGDAAAPVAHVCRSYRSSLRPRSLSLFTKLHDVHLHEVCVTKAHRFAASTHGCMCSSQASRQMP
eukprot:365043-Chlamydomonas_euryale.AAC.21